MLKFPRSVLAKFLPPQQVVEFERLNTAVSEDLPFAAESAQTRADEAFLLSALMRGNPDAARQLADMLQSFMFTQRSDRALIESLARRVADLETQLRAVQRIPNTDQLRQQIADLQTLQATRK